MNQESDYDIFGAGNSTLYLGLQDTEDPDQSTDSAVGGQHRDWHLQVNSSPKLKSFMIYFLYFIQESIDGNYCVITMFSLWQWYFIITLRKFGEFLLYLIFGITYTTMKVLSRKTS